MATNKKNQIKPAISKVNRQIAIGFVLVTIVLIVIIAYFSLSQAKIIITPPIFDITHSTELQILPEVTSTLTGSNILPGVVTSTTITVFDTFIPSEQTNTANKVSGMATIINNYSRNQTLVATTRLLTPNNLLFRTTETIVVPAGGQTKVRIEADEPGEGYIIPPTTFTIPGLWEGLQQFIYATTEEELNLQTSAIKNITLSDLEKAKEILLLQANNQAKAEILNPTDYYILTDAQLISTSSSDPIGSNVEQYTMSITTKVDLIVFNKNDLEKVVVNNLKNSLTNNQTYLNHDLNSLTYELLDYSLSPPSASIKASINGLAINDILENFNKKDILGFSETAIKEYFQKKYNISQIEVVFYPAWVKSVPPLADKVKIIINIPTE